MSDASCLLQATHVSQPHLHTHTTLSLTAQHAGCSMHYDPFLPSHPFPSHDECSYGMLAALAAVLKEDIGGHLDPIVIRMLEALQSDEGVKVCT